MMALANQQYTVVGFTEELDWNPLQFMKPLPRNKLCSVCGLVRKTTANLPCGHVACCVCLEQCKTTDGYACPIDGEICLEEHVDWRDLPAENLLKREVKCWNQRLGCPLMMAASDVHKHFHRECEYHCTFCPRCSATVLCRDMGEHLRASCHAHAATQATECEEKLSDAVEKGIATVVRTAVQEQAGEMKALLERVVRDNGAVIDSLIEVCQSMNSLKESVSQDVAPVGQIEGTIHRVLSGINAIQRALSSEMADMKNQYSYARTSTKRLLEMQQKALAYAERSGTRCDFFVPGIGSLEAKAAKDGQSEYVHGQVYLRGYNMSPGVILKKNGKCIKLNIRLELHVGDHDDRIPWPFEHKIRFTILHPVKNEDKVIAQKTNRSLPAYQKENLSSTCFSCFHNCFDLGDLKRDGYVCNDTLRVTLELL
ncbi:TNF receptor-associated factor 6-like [Rhipicephalus sanguineus]|uniref:TNF receptor-associated factor 6-like n=1 Tax=Rhipicephalus sanguineus TaxID=34632 RepID=UPI00189461E9|nr:TNF receptor-associated factor 6-like [Rhipicephalus sanguineus]